MIEHAMTFARILRSCHAPAGGGEVGTHGILIGALVDADAAAAAGRLEQHRVAGGGGLLDRGLLGLQQRAACAARPAAPRAQLRILQGASRMQSHDQAVYLNTM